MADSLSSKALGVRVKQHTSWTSGAYRAAERPKTSDWDTGAPSLLGELLGEPWDLHFQLLGDSVTCVTHSLVSALACPGMTSLTPVLVLRLTFSS